MSITVDLTAEMVVINPFDFFTEPYAETLPFSIRRRWRMTSRPTWPSMTTDRACKGWWPGWSRRPGHGQFRGGPERPGPRAGELRRAHGARVQTPDATLQLGLRIVPRQRLAAGADAAQAGLAARFVSGYLLKLKADIDPVSGAQGPRPTSPTCTPGPSLYPRRRLDRLDATSGLLCGEGHVPLAASPH